MRFIAEYSFKENCRKKCHFIVCLITCFLISIVSLLSKTIISQGSLIFLIIGEKDSGEIDFYINTLSRTRNNSYSNIDDFHIDNAFINFTKYAEIMNKSEKINIEKENDIPNPLNTSIVRIYFNGKSQNNTIYLMAINTERERDIELGRFYPYPKLKEGECLVHKSLTKNNSKIFNITLSIESFITDTLLYFYNDIKNETDPNLKNLKEIPKSISFYCNIVDILDENFGKENYQDNNFVIMEQEYLYKYLSNFIPSEIKDNFPDYPNILKEIKAEEYSNVLIINFPKNRLNYYTGDDYNDLLDRGVKFMNKVVQKMGTIQNYRVFMPLISSMTKYKYGTTLLNLILNLILLGMFILSIILIHSLILITTETNSFEFGILRLIGNTKKNIILIIIFQCIFFSVPAFILAILFSIIILNRINILVQEELNTDLNITLRLNSFIIAFCLNFFAPIIASIFPIRNILKKNIASSINTILNKTQGIKIEVVSLQKKEFNSLVIYGVITFIYGASIYYFLPLSLMSMNFGMMGTIFFWILYGILLGFILLSRNIEIFLQKILTYTLLFFTKSFTKLFILKNLVAHRLKNKKTSLMFSLSVGAFIMSTVNFDIILQSTKNMIIMINGSEINVYSENSYFTPEEMAPSMMELYDRKLIDSFSLYTVYLNDICLDSRFYLINYGKTIELGQKILSINPDFFSSKTEINYKISQQNKKYKEYSPSEQLYFSDYKGKIGVSGILKYNLDADLDTTLILKLLKNNDQEMLFLSKPGIILDMAEGLIMNGKPSLRIEREAIISFPLYLDMLQKCRNYFAESYEDMGIASYKNLPLWGINIKPKKSATKKDLDEINSILRQKGPEADLWFFAGLKKRMDTTANIVIFIYYIISSIILIFCLFNLMASMTINISEQKKEIAIMRALGTKKRNIIFIYIAEAFILTLSSSLIGFIIGSIISYTMALQWSIFTDVNISFNLPIGGIILIFLFSIFGGILSTYLPARNLLNYSISELIKSN